MAKKAKRARSKPKRRTANEGAKIRKRTVSSNDARPFKCLRINCEKSYKTVWGRRRHDARDHTAQNAQAIAERDAGRVAARMGDSVTAHEHYDAAIAWWPTNAMLYTFKASLYFKEKQYNNCIEQCKIAIKVELEAKSNVQRIASILGRIGDAYLNLNDFEMALDWYGKSLSQCHHPDIVKKRDEIQHDLSLQIANTLFQKGDYPGAMKHYNEAIKRNPDNAVLYSNRAACYQKLMEFHKCIEDCDIALKKNPKFAEAYCLQAKTYKLLSYYAYQNTLAIDPNNREALEEVQKLSNDPSMRVILEQMSQDPKAVQEHL
uniref:C2H2-type domain-containing protein n=1 Tax=Panagrolaimus sp. JU765 TaxID=591449 RepID=A0AC34QF84_9BILA